MAHTTGTCFGFRIIRPATIAFALPLNRGASLSQITPSIYPGSPNKLSVPIHTTEERKAPVRIKVTPGIQHNDLVKLSNADFPTRNSAQQ